MYKNLNLNKARDVRNDEFYTRLSDIEKELQHYKQHFVGKTVFCNCDDPTYSAFWAYFHLNFAAFGLKKLISTHYNKDESTYKLEYTGGSDSDIETGVKTDLSQNGDFRSEECLDLLNECDIVVTNPPFSLFREFFVTLIHHRKKFLIVGSKNAVTYRDFFPFLRDNRVWLGCNSVPEFIQPDGSVKKFGNIGWFTNLDVDKRHEKLLLSKTYSPEMYPNYDNYAAINVDKVSDIPCDYFGNMGVPVTFLDKYCPEQFEVLGITSRQYSPEFCIRQYDKSEWPKSNDMNGSAIIMSPDRQTYRMVYARLLIRRV